MTPNSLDVESAWKWKKFAAVLEAGPGHDPVHIGERADLDHEADLTQGRQSVAAQAAGLAHPEDHIRPGNLSQNRSQDLVPGHHHLLKR